MAATPVRWAVPRIVKNHLTKRLQDMGYQQSPKDILSRFPESTRLTVKQSIAIASTTNNNKKKNRSFFMYEEHSPSKIQDDDPMTPTITTSPMELANLLSKESSSSSSRDQHHHHYYWTSPISTVAPNLLQEEFGWYQQLHQYDDNDDVPSIPQQLLDPRGPSLWMGTFGSGTQCHYDVAHNVILQLYGTKRIRCFPPHVGVTHLHVFPDAHPRARKSQVKNLDVFGYDDESSSNKKEDIIIMAQQQEQYPHYFINPPVPFLDVTLQPGEALEIPAFWFHHVENYYDNDNGIPTILGDDSLLPSVSLNSFVLSEPMMIAQQIFQKASQPMRYGSVVLPTITVEQVPGILRGLGVTLITRLGLVATNNNNDEADAVEFIQRNLLQARYAPLMVEQQHPKDDDNAAVMDSPPPFITTTEDQQQAIDTCVQTILADFDDLIMEGIDDDNDNNVDKNGIVLLVALHLLELWAVQMVGAPSVHDAWKKALQ